jgi:hypothetical protein
MGFLDNVKKAATNVASDAGKASKVAQAQLKLKSLQGDVAGAQKELGAIAYDLVARGAVSHVEMEAPVAKVREAQALVAEKEAEIAELRAQTNAGMPADVPPVESSGPAPSFTAPSEQPPSEPEA